MSIDEIKHLLDVAKGYIGSRAGIISHVGCIATHQALDLAQFAAEKKVDAISSIPPFYYKFSSEAIKQFYFDIVNESGLPMIVYNFPDLSWATLTTQNIKELAENPLKVGIKHTSKDLYQLERMKPQNGKLRLYNGHDEIYLGSLDLGIGNAMVIVKD